jgi:hypothetical protein
MKLVFSLTATCSNSIKSSSSYLFYCTSYNSWMCLLLCTILLDVGGASYNTKATVEAYKEMDWILGEYSAALSTEATATFMFFPSWNKRMNYVRPQLPYVSLCRRFLHKCKLLGSPSRQFQYARVPFWNNIQTPFPNTLGNCKSLPYGLLKAGTALMPHNSCRFQWKSLPKISLRQVGNKEHTYRQLH